MTTTLQSKLNSNLTYFETKKINKDDLNQERSLYKAKLHGIEVVISIGKGKIHKIEKIKVISFPIYLVKKDKTVFQIGVYEVKHKDGILHTTNQILTNASYLIHDPILYSFATQGLIDRLGIKNYKEPTSGPVELRVSELSDVALPESASESSSLESATESSKSASESVPDPNNIFVNIKPELKIPTQTTKDKWIREFMNNDNNYNIKNVNDNGDCLFLTIMYAFKSIGKSTTVQKLRRLVADNFPETIYNNYKEIYDKAHADLVKHNKRLDELNKTYNNILGEFEHQSSPNEKNQIEKVETCRETMITLYKAKETAIDDNVGEINLATQDVEVDEALTQYKHEHTQLLNIIIRNGHNPYHVERTNVIQNEINEIYDKIIANKLALQNFKVLDNVQTFADMQDKIMEPTFWADETCISILESKLKIKLIGISSQTPPRMTCSGEMSNNNVVPNYYIIVEHTGNHYKLIIYKNEAIFEFNKLPKNIKQKVIDRCMKRPNGTWLNEDASIFWQIPDFRNMGRKQKAKQSN